MQKTIIHQLDVIEDTVCLLFQVMLPRNAKKITSIGVTTDATQTRGYKDVVGSIWFWIPGIQYRVFVDTVHVQLQSYGMDSYAPLWHLSFNPFQAWTDGTKLKPFSIEIDKEATMIEGFYRDELKDSFGNPYKVKIYLTIEV